MPNITLYQNHANMFPVSILQKISPFSNVALIKLLIKNCNPLLTPIQWFFTVRIALFIQPDFARIINKLLKRIYIEEIKRRFSTLKMQEFKIYTKRTFAFC